MPKYCYLIVEGPHDAAFVGRFLKLAGISAIYKCKLEEFPRSDGIAIPFGPFRLSGDGAETLRKGLQIPSGLKMEDRDD